MSDDSNSPGDEILRSAQHDERSAQNDAGAPHDASGAPHDAPAAHQDDLWRQALATSVAGSELSRKYRLGLILVASAMVLLPLTYLAVIALAGWLWWWHATVHLETWQDSSFRFGLLYITPLILGGIGFVFMFKPLLARRPEEEAAVTLRPDEQPRLFDFVERLCACVHAPVPKQIDVHIDPASTGAGFRRGFLSILGNDMVLRISLPLVESLSLRELAGTLAHELGHCRQGAAMRARYVIARVNHWFFRAVFLPDAWDQRLLLAGRGNRNPLAQLIVFVAQLFIFLTRVVLLLLMVIGLTISGFLSRQMELDADGYEARVAGSHTLRETLLTGHTLMFAWQTVQETLQLAWLDRRLADDLPALIGVQVDELASSDKSLEQIEQAVFGAPTAVFDTHPSPAARVAHAERSSAPGLPLPELAATELFDGFRDLCRAATQSFYQHVLGAEFDSIRLIDTSLIVAEHAAQRDADRTLFRYFQGQLLGHIELFLPEGWLAPPADAEQTIRALRQSRQGMHAALPKLAAALQQFEKAETARCAAFQAQLLHACKIRFNPSDFGVARGDVEAIGQAQAEGWQAREQALQALQGFVRQAETRLATALCLLHVPEIAAQLDDRELLPRIARLASVLGDLRSIWPHVQPLKEHLFGLGMLMQFAQDHQRNRLYWTEVQRVAGIVHELLSKLHGALAGTPYPFEHAEGDISVAEYLLSQIPPADQVGELGGAAEELLTKLLALYFRAMAQLAVAGEQVEAALGLPRLPDPPPPDSTSAKPGRAS